MRINKDWKRVCFDLDDTICFPNHEESSAIYKYAWATPNWPVIQRMQEIDKAGIHIIIYTARRMLTHKGNVELIRLEVEQLTVNWLKRHKVPYDELIFGKPYADVYIDDKALNLLDL